MWQSLKLKEESTYNAGIHCILYYYFQTVYFFEEDLSPAFLGINLFFASSLLLVIAIVSLKSRAQ